MANAYIALGSNLYDPIQQVKQALNAISQLPETTLIKQSSLYKTAPVGYDNQPDFINAVAQVETALTPEVLMRHLLAIETQFGRERPFPNAPRILDLDLLLYDALCMQTELLTLPHPRMQSRGFVILPLAEIAADLVLPSGESVVELAKNFPQQDIQI
ncbi:MAG: 2-amino-4-hydroxy-6-hydroxymethyldihydropteridine diphosphokinase [Methylophilaceae bacterium 17-44-8]|nr:MAG: 2-amino-4-hydroxy-6-hydroxymethyldihydropteridine diphosphokinase [Methylophilales bacterium 28-44-11]OYY91901.1 MAG: 2-amino-4-hydroxy-6-hydroxymethyldihydropteridine diphosphokinase [Methylophilales bacterium 16-45-7]OZA06284.1 MAG: 2-amino-4-hydroxy-6-hydroxymethyldihydropteridine diphosphokinase [Methylophilaceae bacterium 17-44-8]